VTCAYQHSLPSKRGVLSLVLARARRRRGMRRPRVPGEWSEAQPSGKRPGTQREKCEAQYGCRCFADTIRRVAPGSRVVARWRSLARDTRAEPRVAKRRHLRPQVTSRSTLLDTLVRRSRRRASTSSRASRPCARTSASSSNARACGSAGRRCGPARSPCCGGSRTYSRPAQDRPSSPRLKWECCR
jgi:hypothetical protein